jgi:alkanesulfonate monooxygenase SsuD/methylene tetrahydromethanopterin reductase-like flavin-dependent oxidoreductase (luciferase family)
MMRFGAAFWVQQTGWPELRDACLEVERAGWDSIWIDDHLLADEGDWHDPKLEGWTTLAAVAALTERVRLGLLVSAHSVRNLGLTTKLATTLDAISGGRAILGIGAGWFDREHQAFGLDFGSGFGERLDRLAEGLPLIRRLLDGERVTFEGRYHRLTDAVCEPRPTQARLPILVGGSGPRKTLPMVARHADLWNGFGSAERIAEVSDQLRQRCEEAGRPFATLERTVMLDAVLRDDPADALAVYDQLADRHALRGNVGSDGSPRGLQAWGPPPAIANHVRPYVDLAVSEMVWIFRSPFDLESIRRIGEVRAALA